jgi:glycosyltransferase involved in cell wall biosynthesis
MLVKKQELDPSAIKILFIGHTDDSLVTGCREVAGELMDSGMIEFHPRVDREEAARLLWDADLLLAFPGNRTQIPFKFYEYLSTGKPIFAVAKQGALTEMIAQTGVGICAESDDPSKIAEKFLLSLALPAQSPESIQRRWAERFHFRSLSRQLAHWIQDLVNAHRANHKAGGPAT